MKGVTPGNRAIVTGIIAVVITLGIIAGAAWGLKLSMAWAAKNEEDRVVSDGQAQQKSPAGAAGQVDSAPANIRILNEADSMPTQYESMNSVPTKYELNEGQAASIVANEIQRIFGADLNNTILVVNYMDFAAMSLFAKELPESVREKLIEDYRDWIIPPRWQVTAYIVDGDQYRDCRTSSEFLGRLREDTTTAVTYGNGIIYMARENYELIPIEFRCEVNAITGEIIFIEKDALAELTAPFEERNQTDEQAAEPLYRDYLQQRLPELSIASVEFVDDGGYYEKNGRKIYTKKSKITMSDGSRFLFERGDLAFVKYYPKGTPDYAIRY